MNDKFWNKCIKAELEITSVDTNELDCALKMLMMSCEPAEYFKLLFNERADRGALDACGNFTVGILLCAIGRCNVVTV